MQKYVPNAAATDQIAQKSGLKSVAGNRVGGRSVVLVTEVSNKTAKA